MSDNDILTRSKELQKLHDLNEEKVQQAVRWFEEKGNTVDVKTHVVLKDRSLTPLPLKSISRYEGNCMLFDDVVLLFAKPDTFVEKYLPEPFSSLKTALCKEKDISVSAYCEYVSFFRSLDSGNSGKISVAAIYRIQQHKNSKRTMQEIISLYKVSSKDDEISFEEFVRLGDIAWHKCVSLQHLNACRDLFQRLSTEDSDSISVKSMEPLFREVQNSLGFSVPKPNNDSMTLNQFIGYYLSSPLYLFSCCAEKYDNAELSQVMKEFRRMNKTGTDTLYVQELLDGKYFGNLPEDSVKHVVRYFGGESLHFSEFVAMVLDSRDAGNPLKYLTVCPPDQKEIISRFSDKKELKKLILAFQLMDKDGDGYVSVEEYHAFVHRYGSEEVKQRFTLELFTMAFAELGDSDNDGKITVNDFIRTCTRSHNSSCLPDAWSQILGSNRDINSRILFDMFDLNCDGKLEFLEFADWFESVMGCSEIPLKFVTQMVGAISESNQMFVTWEEVQKAMKDNFSCIEHLNISVRRL